MFNRVIVVVMDGVGIGALPDAAEYGDCGSNTLVNVARSQGGLFLPTLASLGLGCIAAVEGVGRVAEPAAWFGRMAEQSVGKDTTTGHWELMGQPVRQSFPLYPDGFPAELIARFTAVTGREILGNKAASGTEIIAELGSRHIATGFPIVYTSADSVFQIAAHEQVISLATLCEIGRLVRDQVCVGQHAVGRVIVRPFVGVPPLFTRTADRHDYSLEPPKPTVLDLIADSGRAVVGIGKIADIFAGRGITRSYPTRSNDHGLQTLLELLAGEKDAALILANLVEFDSIYGHRKDCKGYAQALERFDGQLALLLSRLGPQDLLILTADHGCDPTTPGTDHAREYVPLIVYHRGRRGNSLGERQTFADVGATIAEIFGLSAPAGGHSFLAALGGENNCGRLI